VAAERDHYIGEVVKLMYRFEPEWRGINRADAEDIVQSAMMAAWRKRDTYQPIKPLRNWLFLFVQNTYRADHALRAKRKHRIDMLEWVQSNNFAPPSQVVGYAESIRRDAEQEKYRSLVAKLIETLPEPLLTTFRHVYYDNTTKIDVSRTTGVGYSTVFSRIRRGVAQLRNRFGDLEGGVAA